MLVAPVVPGDVTRMTAQPRRRLVRLGVRLAVFLVVGATVTVGVAWSFAWWQPWWLEREDVEEKNRLERAGRPARGALIRIAVGQTERDIVEVWNWTPMRCEQIVTETCGWPTRALSMTFSQWGDPKTEWRPVGMPPIGRFGSALPLEPVWPGFFLDTLFYAALAWMLWSAPFATRRLIRRRRGLCPWCAYPAGASATCTECGRELPAKLRAST